MMKTKRNINHGKLQKVADVLKAISHPIRLEILEVLEAYETLPVSKIQEEISCSIEQSLLSHHLIKMKDKGVLKSEKKGKYIYYSLAYQEIVKILDCIENSVF